MTETCKTAWPVRAGRVAAGLCTAWLLAGCGGGGGGGSSSPPPQPPPAPTVLATADVVAGSTTAISTTPTTSATASTPTVTADGGTTGDPAATITISTDPSAPSLSSGYTADSATYTIAVSPAGQAFPNGLTLSFPYTQSSSNSASPLIYYYDGTIGQWTAVSGNDTTSIAPGGTVISVTVSQLPAGSAAFAVLQYSPQPPAAPPPP